jgi:hypothetical protein
LDEGTGRTRRLVPSGDGAREWWCGYFVGVLASGMDWVGADLAVAGALA